MRICSFVRSSDLAIRSGAVLKASGERKDLSGLLDSFPSDKINPVNLTGLNPGDHYVTRITVPAVTPPTCVSAPAGIQRAIPSQNQFGSLRSLKIGLKIFLIIQKYSCPLFKLF